MNLNVLRCVWQFLSSISPISPLYKSFISPCLENSSHVYEGSTHKVLLDWVKLKAFRLTNSSPQTDCLHPLSHTVGVLHLLLFSVTIFTLTALLISLTVYPLFSCGLDSQDFLLPSVQLYNLELTITFNLWSSLSASTFPSSYSLTSFKRKVSRHLLVFLFFS